MTIFGHTTSAHATRRARSHSPLVAVLALLLSPWAGIAHAAVLEVPGNDARLSGISFASGWKCPPNDDITIVFDDGSPLRAATRIARGDTTGVCGNDGRNGYILQFNYNLLTAGEHTVRVRQAGVEFATATFQVTTFGVSFLSGAAASLDLPSFPEPGSQVSLAWDEGTQNFQIIGQRELASAEPGVCGAPLSNSTVICDLEIESPTRQSIINLGVRPRASFRIQDLNGVGEGIPLLDEELCYSWTREGGGAGSNCVTLSPLHLGPINQRIETERILLLEAVSGTYTLELFLLDHEDRESNRISQTFVVDIPGV